MQRISLNIGRGFTFHFPIHNMTRTETDLNKKIKSMSNKQLLKEWNSINSHINRFSFGMFELTYRRALENEIDRRKTVKQFSKT